MRQINERNQKTSLDPSDIRFRKPVAADGVAIAELIAACPPLDQNSVYCNLLQCSDFADTCIVAEIDNAVVGWISGYLPPQEQATLFVWQVAVHSRARGCGLAGRMLSQLLERTECASVTQLKTTITSDNEGSFALFRSFAKRMNANFDESSGFDKEKHFKGLHDSERLITIGPFCAERSTSRESRSAA